MGLQNTVTSVVGHQLIMDLLDRAVAEDRVRHAYLLTGPARVGKSTVARWLSLRLNCQEPSAPCGSCRTCTRILHGAFPDVRSIQLSADRDPTLGLPLDVPARTARSTERVISIEQVRALQHDAALAPSEAPKKTYIIVGAENLSTEAANCLLKTLEEPPDLTVLILTAADAMDVLPTVVSRCQTIRLGLVPRAEIAAALTSRFGCTSGDADLLARVSGGRPGWAIEAAPDQAHREERAHALDDLTSAIRPSRRERLALAERLAGDYSRDPRGILHKLTLWQSWWWDVLLIQKGCEDLVTNVDRTDDLHEVASSVSWTASLEFARLLDTTGQYLLHNVNPRLALENLLLAAPTGR